MAWVKLPPINFNLSYIFNSLLIGTACRWRVSKWRAGELKCCPQVSVSASGLPPLPPSGEASRAPAPVSPDPGVHVDTPRCSQRRSIRAYKAQTCWRTLSLLPQPTSAGSILLTQRTFIPSPFHGDRGPWSLCWARCSPA